MPVRRLFLIYVRNFTEENIKKRKVKWFPDEVIVIHRLPLENENISDESNKISLFLLRSIYRKIDIDNSKRN